MKLLLIENDAQFLARLRDAMTAHDSGISVVEARSRDSGIRALREDVFDLIVCDLSIPTNDEALDEDVSHGRAVHAAAEEIAPGTRFAVLSGFLGNEVLTQLLRHARQEDFFGAGRSEPNVTAIEKRNWPDILADVGRIAQETRILSDIELVCAAGCELDDAEKRVIRMFARRLEGVRADVSKAAGGLSNSRTVRLRVVGPRGQLRTLALGKLGLIAGVQEEQRRGDRFVTALLPPGGSVANFVVVQADAGGLGGVFYRFAEEYKCSLFCLIKSQAPECQRAVQLLVELERAWQGNFNVETVTVGDVRRLCMSDDSFNETAGELASSGVREFEKRRVTIRQCVQHGDLHGENVLVRPDGTPLLVDYARAGVAPASLDPVTLELSFLFHPEGRAIARPWPSSDLAERWHDLGEYIASCPVSDAITGCREWALSVANSPREVHAVAYAVAVRQLRFQDVDRALASAVMGSAMRAFDGG